MVMSKGIDIDERSIRKGKQEICMIQTTNPTFMNTICAPVSEMGCIQEAKRSLREGEKPVNRQNNRQKKTSAWPVIVILIAMAAANIGEIDGKIDGTLLVFLLSVIVIIASIALGLRLRMKLGDGSKNGAGMRDGSRTRSIRELDKSSGESAIHRFDPRSKSFVKPDAPCIVCEHTGEDHLERDKQNRIRQLDDWLKTGLIDRSEYRVLKDRFERDL